MKGLSILSVFVVFAWAIIESAFMGLIPLLVAGLGFALAFVIAGCFEKPWGDTFAWVFFGVCVILIGISMPAQFAESTARAAVKAASLVLMVLFAYMGSKAHARQAAH